MRKISENDLARLRTKGGVTVKRRLGTGKTPEPEVKEATALSGATAPEAPVSASVLELLQTVIANNTKAIERIAENLTVPKVAPKVESILPPRAEVKKVELPPMQPAVKKAEVTPISLRVIKQVWSYAVNRDKQGQMKEAVALAKSGKKIVFKMLRSEGLIEKIEISNGSKAKRMLGISRSDDNLIENVIETG